MEIANEPIFQWLAQYAYQPEMVYAMIVFLMFASSFGLPLPEEVPLVSAGVLAFMASHPDQFPPPYPGARGVETITLAIVCFSSVFFSDLLIYGLGKFFGATLMRSRRFNKMVSEKTLDRVKGWAHKYGIWAVAIFRFTPGVRFPGHMACGMLGFPPWKFMLVDGMAALLSVPTQILLIAYYGETILTHIHKFKMVVLAVIVFIVSFVLIKKLRNWTLQKSSPS